MHTDPFIGRKVTFIFGPIALAIATLLSAKSQAWFGVQVNTAEAAAFILSIAAGIITWLYNLGKHEVAQVTGVDEDTVDEVVRKVLAEKLPASPSDPAPGAGSPAAPGAPPSSIPVPGGSTGQGPGGTSAGQ